MNPDEVIKLACEYYENDKFYKFALAVGPPRNLAWDWINAKAATDRDLDSTLRQLGYANNRSVFETWWEDLHSRNTNYAFIKNIFETEVPMWEQTSHRIFNRSILDLGKQDTASTTDTRYRDFLLLPDNLFRPYDRSMTALFNAFYALYFRRVRQGDNVSASDYTNEFGFEVSGASSGSDTTQRINVEGWEEIPEGFWSTYSVSAPDDNFVEANVFIKKSIEDFINNIYLNTSKGRKMVAFRHLYGLGNWDFTRFWVNLRNRYRNNEKINNLLDKLIPMENPGVDFKLEDLGTSSEKANSRELTSALRDLINAIIEIERESMLKAHRVTGYVPKALSLLADGATGVFQAIDAILTPPRAR